jgi:hypothetical protein
VQILGTAADFQVLLPSVGGGTCEARYLLDGVEVDRTVVLDMPPRPSSRRGVRRANRIPVRMGGTSLTLRVRSGGRLDPPRRLYRRG